MKEVSLKILKEKHPKLFARLGKLSDSNDVSLRLDEHLTQLSISSATPQGFVFIDGVESLSTIRSSSPQFEKIKNAKAILVVEGSLPRFESFLQNAGFEKLLENSRFVWIVEDQRENIFSTLFGLLRNPFAAFEMDIVYYVSQNSSQEKSFFTQTIEVWDQVKQKIRELSGSVDDSWLGFQNSIQNLQLLEKCPGLNRLKKGFSGIPAVIVATGPSLKNSLACLRKIQNKVLIVSVDASFNILLEADIRPHFVCSLERILGSEVFFERAFQRKEADSSHLIAFPFLPREVLEAFRGNRKWMLYRDYGYFQFFENQVPKGMLSTSTSVSHMAFRVADYLGCDPISIVGQDLAYDPISLQSHSAGVAYGDWEKKKTFEELERHVREKGALPVSYVPGNFVESVPTDALYRAFIEELSWEASQTKARVFNCTEGGAKIPGVEWISLEKLSEKWIDQPDLFKKIDEAWAPLETKTIDTKPWLNFAENLSGKLESLLTQIESIRSSNGEQGPALDDFRKVLRKTQRDLLQNGNFLYFIVQNAGSFYLDLERKFRYAESRDDWKSIELADLQSWFSESLAFTRRMQTLLQNGSDVLDADDLKMNR